MIISFASCLFYRVIGLLLTCTSLFTIAITFRYFLRRCRRYRKGLSISPILIGMLISLLTILCTGIPVVLIQCFTCRPFKTYLIICKINGFICFAVGNFNMYMLVLLSIFRYINIVQKRSSSSCLLEYYRGLSVIICALISLCWAIPPLLNVRNTDRYEGIGFHCGVDWNNSVFQSRFFLYSLLICNYFILLSILIYSNLRIYFVLRHLLKSNQSLLSTILCVSISNSNVQKYIFGRQLERKLNRLQRLKIDQRYAHITAIMIGQFIIGWTPYAILALIIINGGIESVRRYSMFSIVSELLAKFSLILNPLILIYTNKMRQY